MAEIKTVIVPEKNSVDIEEISEEILSGMEIVYAADINKVLETALKEGKK